MGVRGISECVVCVILEWLLLFEDMDMRRRLCGRA